MKNMKMKKILLIALIAVIAVSICLTTVEATHVYKKNGYTMKISDKTYNTLKKHDNSAICKKVTKKVKVPIYKNKKIKTKQWVYKNVLYSEYWYDDWSGSTWEEYDTSKYWNNGWEWYGSFSRENSDYTHIKYYEKFKKYTTVTKTKKVKTGKYKTVKKTAYMIVCHDSRYGDHKLHTETYSFKPWNKIGMVVYGG